MGIWWNMRIHPMWKTQVNSERLLALVSQRQISQAQSLDNFVRFWVLEKATGITFAISVKQFFALMKWEEFMQILPVPKHNCIFNQIAFWNGLIFWSEIHPLYVLPVVRASATLPLRAQHNAGCVAKTSAVLGTASKICNNWLSDL